MKCKKGHNKVKKQKLNKWIMT